MTPLPFPMLLALALVPAAALILLPPGPHTGWFVFGLAGAILGLLGRLLAPRRW